MRLTVEVEGSPGRFVPPGDGAALVAFMSFAVTRGFGAVHPLILLAERLQEEHGVRMGPLTTFYDEVAEDAEDREKLELVWQDCAALTAALEGLAEALERDGEAVALARRGGVPTLGEQARAVAGHLRAAGGSRARMVYRL
jgi:hypothetical protein